MGLGGLPMGLGVSLWGCGEPTEGFYGAVRGVLVGCPYGSRWRVPMGLGVFSVGLWVSLWVLGCPYGSWRPPYGSWGVPMGLWEAQRAFMGL